MKLELEDLKPEHFDEIQAQATQTYFKDYLETHPKYKEEVVQRSVGKTGRLDGVIIGICGIIKVTNYIGEGWAYFSTDLPKMSLSVVREIRKFLDSQKHIRRIQCTVDVYNTKAVKFAEALGFKAESILKCYGPEGHDHIMFTIIHRNLDWEAK